MDRNAKDEETGDRCATLARALDADSIHLLLCVATRWLV